MTHKIRPIPLTSALIILATSVLLVARADALWWVIPLGLIGPDLSFLAAIGGPTPVQGNIAARVVRTYNLFHHPAGPILAVGASLAFGRPTALAASLAWGSHLLGDRGVGYGMRAPDGSITRPTKHRTRQAKRYLSRTPGH
jgi:hypothetical protein